MSLISFKRSQERHLIRVQGVVILMKRGILILKISGPLQFEQSLFIELLLSLSFDTSFLVWLFQLRK